jgi:hypothetical protein
LISACLVTRGDVDLTEIIASIPYDDVVVWDNSKRADLKAYGRYAAIKEAKGDLIFVQDDDCILNPETFLMIEDAYDGSPVVNAGKPGSVDVPWVGFGALFHRDDPHKFHRIYWDRWGMDDLFYNYCDPQFTVPARAVTIVGDYRDLPWALDDSRTSLQPEHWATHRPEALRRAEWISQSSSLPRVAAAS